MHFRIASRRETVDVTLIQRLVKKVMNLFNELKYSPNLIEIYFNLVAHPLLPIPLPHLI